MRCTSALFQYRKIPMTQLLYLINTKGCVHNMSVLTDKKTRDLWQSNFASFGFLSWWQMDKTWEEVDHWQIHPNQGAPSPLHLDKKKFWISCNFFRASGKIVSRRPTPRVGFSPTSTVTLLSRKIKGVIDFFDISKRMTIYQK